MDNILRTLPTQLPGICWPLFPPVQASAVLATLYQIEKGQELPAGWHHARQMEQAKRLLHYARSNIPYYSSRLERRDPHATLTDAEWRAIPVLSRKDVQAAGDDLFSRQLPKEHGDLVKISTSGSTGMPVTCGTTKVTRFMYLVFMCLEHFWHNRDFSGTHLAIRPDGKAPPGKLLRSSSWGADVARSGPSLMLNVRTDTWQQIEILQRENPVYLLSLPSNLKALADLCIDSSIRLSNLKGVRSYGEILPADVRQLCVAAWDVKMTDIYSSQEIGFIAIECPEQGQLHVLTDGVLLEVLDDNGNACQVGETGQVVVTPLLNYGSPLIRYALGDFAEVGAPCPCGRSMPVLKKVLGRQRNMLIKPDGSRLWPSFAVREWAQDVPLTQFQFVQKTVDRIEARLVCDRPLTNSEEARLVAALHQRLTYPFNIDIHYLDVIPRSKSGKFEDFMSEL